MAKSGKYAPIGVFDSGYGGLTVLKELTSKLPTYDFVYIGDNARTPYGTRSFETVYDYTLQAVITFFSMGCELVIIACNTASAKALRNIQQNYLPKNAPNKRVLGVIRPSTEIIGELTNSKKVGVLATQGTVNSKSYPIEIGKFFPDVKVYQEACNIWVPLIENGLHNTEGGHFFIQHHIKNILSKDSDIDTLILGCTHYPIIEQLIIDRLPKNIKLISQGKIVAEALKDYLERHPEMDFKISKGGAVKYFTTDNPETFENRSSLFLDHAISCKKIKLIE